MADSSDPDSNFPGISSIFTTTQSGLKPRRRSRTVDPDDEPQAEKDPAEQPPAKVVEEEAKPEQAVQDVPPPEAPVAPAEESPPVDEAGIQLSGGLSMVDTAELKSLTPPPQKPVAQPPPKPQPAPPPARKGPPAPPTPVRIPNDSFDEESEDYETRRAMPAPKPTNWLLYGVAVVVVIGLIAALIVTVMTVTG